MAELTTYIAIGAAVVGVLVTIIYVVLLVLGVSTLRDIRNSLRDRQQ